MRLESDITLELLPPARLPTINVELVRVERSDRHGCVGSIGLVDGHIVRTQLKPAVLSVTGLCQSVHRQVWIGQHIVIDNVVEKYGFRIERVR